MSEVKRYEVKGKFESTDGEGISLIDPKMVLEDDYDATCHAAEVYFGSWKRTEQELDAQRLRADTAEAELEDVIDELRVTVEDRDNAKRNSSAFEERMGDLQVANGKLQDKLAAAEQRIAELKSVFERMLEDDDMPVHWFAQRIDAALNPNPEAESHG